MNELVSVIIPVYNKQEYLSSCIDSVLAQTYEPLEILCVDDGSEDDSRKILSDYEAKGNVRLFSQKNSGISAARNRGIEEAKGTYLMFLDADDALNPEAVFRLVRGMEENEADLCSGRHETVKNGQVIDTADEPDHRFVSGTGMLEMCLLDYITTHHVWAAMFRREFVGSTRFDETASVHEDNHFMFDLAVKKPRCQLIDQVVYRYTIAEDSFSRSGFSGKKAEDILRLARGEYAVVRERFPEFRNGAENLMIKADMAVLANHPEKHISDPVIRDLLGRKKYFVPESSFDKLLFALTTHHLYWVYGILYNLRFKPNR
ncbi:MAG: glycosyltransferase [Solobacterium sp.]|nr:glycosyltransferase [Solobacterium sp.]